MNEANEHGGEKQGQRARKSPLSPEAVRALTEAAERRKAVEAAEKPGAAQREINGRGGLDPARFGDWEIKGIASDF